MPRGAAVLIFTRRNRHGMAPATPVVLYRACSLDGFIAATDGPVGRLARFSAEGEDCCHDGLLAGVGSLVMGSRTHADDAVQLRYSVRDVE